MQFQSIEIREIQNLEGHAQDVFLGTVELKFRENIGGVDVGQVISVQSRISHKTSATFSSLESAFFSECHRLLEHAARLLEQESLESLRQQERAARESEQAKWNAGLPS